MSPHFWIGIQVFLDLLMVALLLWFLRFFYRQDASWRDHEKAIAKAEVILGEMREIGRVLENNLEEKKHLSSRILTQLDQALKKAEESHERISAILPQIHLVSSSQPIAKDPEKTRSSVHALFEKGLQKEEIARHLGISQGEVELMMKLWPPERKA